MSVRGDGYEETEDVLDYNKPLLPQLEQRQIKEIAIKYDQDKLKWSLLPWDAIEEVVKVFTFGANKYGDRNWEKGFNFTRNLDALHRHIVQWEKGQDNDNESSLNHLAHAMCNLLFLLTFQLRGVGTDDRAKY